MVPLGLVMLKTGIIGVGGYREDQVFLVVPDTSAFGNHVLIILGTSTIRRVITVIKKSEMDGLSTPWVTTKLATQLSFWKMEAKGQLWEGAATVPIDLLNLNEVLRMKKEESLPFSTHIIHGKLQLRLMGHKMYMMITALSEGKGTNSYGQQVQQNIYIDLRGGSNSVSVVIKNTTGRAVILNKGMAFAKVVAANKIPTLHLKPGTMEALDEMQGIKRPRMSISGRRRKLIQALDLSRLQAWLSGIPKAAKELLMEYHNVFALKENELGCTSTIEHMISLTDLEPYKERFC